MNWVSKVDYVDEEPLKRRGTKKKVWDELTQAWKDVTLWTIPANRELCKWLQQDYPNFSGWRYVWSDTKVVMEETVYLHYCLKFGL